MLSPAIKEAIKVALSIGIAIALALFFQWEKPYWAAVTVIAVSMSATFGHGIQRANLLLLGTLTGICYAFLMISLSPQDRFLFICFFTLFLAVCVFFSDNKKYGYAFTMAFTVFAIIAMMGRGNGEVSFNYAILRAQEATLGVLVYSAVFKLLWPVSAESRFFGTLKTIAQQFQLTQATIDQALVNNDTSTLESLQLNIQPAIDELQDLLDLPMSNSYRLRHEKAKWQAVVNACSGIKAHINRSVPPANQRINKDYIDQQLVDLSQEITLLEQALKGDKSSTGALIDYWQQGTNSTEATPNSTTAKNLLQLRLKRVMSAVAISSTCFGLWIYFAIPGSFIFPMLGAVFANVTRLLPDSIIRQAEYFTLLWGAVFLAQFCLVLTNITELWQLCGFYMVNTFFIYAVFHKPSDAVIRMLGGIMMLIMTMGALYATPKFDIVMPILMLIIMLMVLAIARFYTRLFRL
ncbi:FUSC family protein [Shewanella colwelliana]|uniref:FUSC family protein n=1 Tax=Shewanella colwelliana TaxID=23 RepID=UPI0037352835